MKKTFLIFGCLLSLLAAGLHTSPVFAAATNCPNQSILGFPAWFNGLKCEKKEGVTQVLPTSINATWIIGMNIVQWLILSAGYVSLYFVIWGGFKYITAQGEPGEITAAKNTVTNAVIGLLIVLVAVAIVRTVQASVSGAVV